VIAGYPLELWLDAYMHSNGGWPDGKPYAEQENVVVSLFSVFEKVKQDIINKKRYQDG